MNTMCFCVVARCIEILTFTTDHGGKEVAAFGTLWSHKQKNNDKQKNNVVIQSDKGDAEPGTRDSRSENRRRSSSVSGAVSSLFSKKSKEGK